MSIISRYPFDWKTPGGYMFCLCIQTGGVLIFIKILLCTLILSIGFCMIMIEFVSDIEANLRHLNRKIVSKKKIDVKNKLFDIIEFHSEAIELSDKLLNFMIMNTH